MIFLKHLGRAKEILVTSGGENIAPVPIENSIKAALPCLSNAVVVGDGRKYLTAFLTLQTLPEDPNEPDLPGSKLNPMAIQWCRSIGSLAETVDDIVKGKDEAIFFAVQVQRHQKS